MSLGLSVEAYVRYAGCVGFFFFFFFFPSPLFLLSVLGIFCASFLG